MTDQLITTHRAAPRRPVINDDPTILAALTALRDVGLATGSDQLNEAWAELTGRTPPTSGLRCDRDSCTATGTAFDEPKGVWCPPHVPTLWRPDNERFSPWASPRCAKCGGPGRYPASRFGTAAKCRDHAPERMRPYLMEGKP